MIAYFLSPIADRLQALGLNRAWSAVLIVGIVAVLVALALVLLVPVLVDQVRQLVTALPDEMQRLQGSLRRAWPAAGWGPAFPRSKARSIA